MFVIVQKGFVLYNVLYNVIYNCIYVTEQYSRAAVQVIVLQMCSLWSQKRTCRTMEEVAKQYICSSVFLAVAELRVEH